MEKKKKETDDHELDPSVSHSDGSPMTKREAKERRRSVDLAQQAFSEEQARRSAEYYERIAAADAREEDDRAHAVSIAKEMVDEEQARRSAEYHARIEAADTASAVEREQNQVLAKELTDEEQARRIAEPDEIKHERRKSASFISAAVLAATEGSSSTL